MKRKTVLGISLVLAMLLFAVSLTACYPYNHVQEKDMLYEVYDDDYGGYKLGDAHALNYLWDGETMECDIVVPDVFNLYKVTEFGSQIHGGRSFIDYEKFWEKHPEAYGERIDRNYNDVDEKIAGTMQELEIIDYTVNEIKFNLKLSKEITTFNTFDALFFYEVDEENNSAQIYLPVFFITVDELNSVFYSDEHGILYEEGTKHSPVSFFYYQNRSLLKKAETDTEPDTDVNTPE